MRYLCFLKFLDFTEKDNIDILFIREFRHNLFEINIFRTIDKKKAEILRERDVERERERERDIKKISRVFFFAAFLARRQNCQQDAGSPFTVTTFDILRMYK